MNDLMLVVAKSPDTPDAGRVLPPTVPLCVGILRERIYYKKSSFVGPCIIFYFKSKIQTNLTGYKEQLKLSTLVIRSHKACIIMR